MVQVEIFTTLGQSVAGATIPAQQQVNEWFDKHPHMTLRDVHIETQVVREAAEIIWCTITVTYRAPPHTDTTPPEDIP